MKRVFAGALVLLVFSPLQASDCPPGYVLGSTICVPWNLCPDGTVLVGEACRNAPRAISKPSMPKPPSSSTPPKIGMQEKRCKNVINKKSIGNIRRVLFVKGALPDLFTRYVKDAELENVDIPLDRLEVIYFPEPKKRESLRWGREVKLSLGEMVRGRLPEFAWQRSLSGRRSIWIEGAANLAAQYHADLVCGDDL